MRKLKCLFIALGLIAVSARAAESVEFADKVIREHGLAGARAAMLKDLLTKSPSLTRNIGTEDPAVLQGPNNSWHMASREQCQKKVIATGLIARNPAFEKICKSPWMSPVLPAPGSPITEAKTCIDQFEFPNIPCEYPIVWSTSAQAKKICQAMGKRVCNSHEWEGACAAGVEKDPYLFHLGDRQSKRREHNKSRELKWAFQWQTALATVSDTRGICGVYTPQDSEIASPMKENLDHYYSRIGKSRSCNGSGSDYKNCGTHSWPSGFKYDCRSAQDVFDLHGNLAEVVSFPLSKEEIAQGENAAGMTERKGSFFVYRGDYANLYPDDCRVRQPYEHFEKYASGTMAYYQEGFRCCKDVE